MRSSGDKPLLYVSFWAKNTDDTMRWSNTNFREALPFSFPPLPGIVPQKPISVYMDGATANFIRTRGIEYKWDQYLYEAQNTGKQEWAIRITAVDVNMNSGTFERVDLEWDEFFSRYIGNARPFKFEDEMQIADE